MQFTKKTSSRLTFIKLILKFFLILIIIFTAVYLLNKIDFPAPIKEIEKIISNENFKIVK
tara:strand:- start:2081 stop:2260 length:180 start_codon:yes stop_codon:yes gene_type:complete